MDLFHSGDGVKRLRSRVSEQDQHQHQHQHQHHQFMSDETENHLSSSSNDPHGAFSFLTDFDTAFSQFSTDFALNSNPSSSQGPTTSASANDPVEDISLHFPHMQSLTPLLNEKESNAFSDFLERVMVDRDFLLDPKMMDELPQWTEPEPLSRITHNSGSGETQLLDNANITIGASNTGIIVDRHSVEAINNSEYHLDHGLQEIHEDIQKTMGSIHGQEVNHLSGRSSDDRNGDDTRMVHNNDNYHASSNDTTSGAEKRYDQSAKKRENLTEDQKRLNHISSEKRRRALIKYHFDEICSLVPQLDTSSAPGLSKSEALNGVYEYMARLVDQNKALTKLLHANGINDFSCFEF